ncbi:peptidylprolyl isomerase [Weissella diestrammenae]|uniref:peptidylprolyl isomerase n=1 Tax=Weissella diestrammenae TaxID=1162633 RepID=UPI00195FD600|nr:peptidylprolyl isomerase [Weissella diestrammenae]MCM0582073.1 peptidylprolyl isomerase [Weissella diestrammenae]
MKKIWALIAVVVVAGGLVVFGLSGGKNVATTDAGSVSEKSLYSALKATPEGKQTFANLVIKKVLSKDYADKVDQKEIDKQYNKAKKQYGESFESTLSQSGMTTATYKDNLYLSALEKVAYKANQKFTEAQLKKAYKDYTPNVSISVIKTASEDDAKAVINDLNDGKNFADEAKAKSTDETTKTNGGKMAAFDSTASATTVSADVMKAAFALKKGEYTKTPVKVAGTTDATTGTATSDAYYVIKMNSRTAKKSYKQLKSKMKDILVDKKLATDTSAMTAFVGEQLNKAKVNITDKDLKSALVTYTEAANSASQAKSSSATKKTSSQSDSKKASTAKTSTSSSSGSSSSSSSSSK